jgi:hypothetical protein
MTKNKIIFYNIANSLAFAVVILISSYIIEDSHDSETMMFLLMSLWFIPYSILNEMSAKCKKEIVIE